MITGDYRRTAERIARNIGLIEESGQILEGEGLSDLSDEQLRERVNNTAMQLGDEYRAYAQATKRIIPGLW